MITIDEVLIWIERLRNQCVRYIKSPTVGTYFPVGNHKISK